MIVAKISHGAKAPAKAEHTISIQNWVEAPQVSAAFSIRHDGSSAGGSSADPMAFSHEPHRALIEEFLIAIDERREAMNSARSAFIPKTRISMFC